MIELREGADLFELAGEVDAIVNPCNCVGAAGAGLSKHFHLHFGEQFLRSYRHDCKTGALAIGRCSFWFAPSGLVVVNFPTKSHWTRDSQLSHIESGLVSMIRGLRYRKPHSGCSRLLPSSLSGGQGRDMDDVIEGVEPIKVAIPALGCGLGGLSWPKVKRAVEDAFAPLPDFHAILIPPQ